MYLYTSVSQPGLSYLEGVFLLVFVFWEGRSRPDLENFHIWQLLLRFYLGNVSGRCFLIWKFECSLLYINVPLGDWKSRMRCNIKKQVIMSDKKRNCRDAFFNLGFEHPFKGCGLTAMRDLLWRGNFGHFRVEITVTGKKGWEPLLYMQYA